MLRTARGIDKDDIDKFGLLHVIAMPPEKVELERCPVCGNRSQKRRLPTPHHWIPWGGFVGGAWGLQRCRECGFVFVNPRPSDALLSQFYSDTGYKPHNADGQSRATVNHLLSRIERHRPGLDSSGHFLDFGCGGGSFLRAAAQRGWNCSGYDVSAHAAESCQAQGLRVTNNLASIEEPCDAILMCQSLEHVSDFDTSLTTLHRILRPRTGRLFVAVPNSISLRAVLSPPLLSQFLSVEERYCAFPIHLSYFTQKTLTHLLARYGFARIAMETYAFGIDSYFRSEYSCGDSPHKKRAGDRDNRFTRAAKQMIKSVFMGAGLGENLLGVFADAAGPQ